MKKVFSLSLLIAAMAAMVFTSCNKDTYTVTFNSQGGSNVAAIKVKAGGTISAPTAPTRSGYVFGGWYKESSCTTEWNFSSDKVNSDITLYAKWASGSAETVSLDFIDYYGDYAGVGTENFYVGLYNDAYVEYVLDLYSPDAVPNGTEFSPAVGTYNLDVNTTGAKFTIGFDDSGVWTSGEDFDSQFVSGSVKISKVGNDYKVEGNLVDDLGVNYVFVYQGPFAGSPAE